MAAAMTDCAVVTCVAAVEFVEGVGTVGTVGAVVAAAVVTWRVDASVVVAEELSVIGIVVVAAGSGVAAVEVTGAGASAGLMLVVEPDAGVVTVVVAVVVAFGSGAAGRLAEVAAVVAGVSVVAAGVAVFGVVALDANMRAAVVHVAPVAGAGVVALVLAETLSPMGVSAARGEVRVVIASTAGRFCVLCNCEA